VVKIKKVRVTNSERHTNMNRRDFIKAAVPAVIIPAVAITCKYEDDEKGPTKESANWNYRVYCYERGQGEWTFSQNIRGSFAYQREYMTFDQEQDRMVTHSTLQEAFADQSLISPYAGWMHEGKLHFSSLEEAQDFVDMHARAKDDTGLIDSIYDIYYVDRDNLEYESCQPHERKVAHYWFNGDTGRTIEWVNEEDKANSFSVEFG
jgi:hypothetical protein